MSRVPRLRTVNEFLFLIFLLLLVVSAIEWSLWEIHFAGFSHSSHFVSVSPLAPAVERFADWTNFLRRSAQLGTTGMLTRRDLGLPFPYPLPAVVVFYPFARFSHDPLRDYLIFASGSYIAVVAYFSWGLWRRTRSFVTQALLWGSACLFHPFWFLLDRGNIEIFLWLLITVGLYAFVRKHHMAAAILFGIAGSMKIYPAVLLLLLWKRREIKAMLVGISALILMTLAIYHAAGPTVMQAVHDMSASARYLNETQIAVVNSKSLRWDHSIFGLLKQTSYVFERKFLGHSEAGLRYDTWIRPYGILALLCFCGLYLWRIQRLPLLNQFICLLLCSILLPFVSYDYTLMHLSLIFAVLVLVMLEYAKDAPSFLKNRPWFATAVVLGITCSPLTNLADSDYGGQIKCILLLLLFVLALRHPLPSHLFDDQHFPCSTPAVSR